MHCFFCFYFKPHFTYLWAVFSGKSNNTFSSLHLFVWPEYISNALGYRKLQLHLYTAKENSDIFNRLVLISIIQLHTNKDSHCLFLQRFPIIGKSLRITKMTKIVKNKAKPQTGQSKTRPNPRLANQKQGQTTVANQQQGQILEANFQFCD